MYLARPGEGSVRIRDRRDLTTAKLSSSCSNSIGVPFGRLAQHDHRGIDPTDQAGRSPLGNQLHGHAGAAPNVEDPVARLDVEELDASAVVGVGLGHQPPGKLAKEAAWPSELIEERAEQSGWL